MIVDAHGDLLDANVDALINTVNCVGVMGKGIALQVKRRYPGVYKSYVRACQAGDVRIGRMLPIATEELAGPRYVINFPTKKHWRAPSQLAYIEAGLIDLRRVAAELELTTLAIPPLGAGNGGLDWRQVEPMIRQAFQDDPHLKVLLFPPSGGPRPIQRGRDLEVTPFRGLVLALIESYARQRLVAEPWEDPAGVSHLELQKLVYFAKVINPAMRVDFEVGKYGPYSDVVRRVLQEMEGVHTLGLGDGSARVLDFHQIESTEEGTSALRHFEARHDEAPAVREVVNRVCQLVSGFEGPYGLELLATTHWVTAAAESDISLSNTAKAVRTWSRRKGRIFTDGHVGAASRHLLSLQG